MKILFNDFSNENPKLKEEMLINISKVLDSGDYILGMEVEKFEKLWSNYCNVKYTIGVGNCFDATMLGLQALGISKGDEVITTPMTAYATTLAILKVGATPVLVDIDLSTGHLSLESAEKNISKSTKALLYVHLYGQTGNLDSIVKFCNKFNILLIEDCAQAHGAKFNNISVGSFGIFSAWSFYPTKNLGCIGDGGAFTTNDEELAIKLSMLRNYGQSKRYYHDVLGINSRLDELQAGILNQRFKYLNEFNNKRKKIADYYNKNINNDFIEKLASPIDSESHVYHLYVLRSKRRDQLQKYLKNNLIDTLIHYPVLVNLQKASIGKTKTSECELPNAVYHSNTCFSIPCHPQMNDAEMKYVVDILNDFK